MNKLLARQLKRNAIELKDIPENIQNLLKGISVSYDHYETDRALLERSIDLSSQELTGAYRKLSIETERQKIVLDKLKSAISSLRDENEMIFASKVIGDDDLVSISEVLTNQVEKRKKAEDKLVLYERAINSSSNGICLLYTSPSPRD